MSYPTQPPLPNLYVEHARVINALAGEALNLKIRHVENTRAKVAVGLSLQAAELAGKAMLRAFGSTVEEIKQRHAHHNLLELYDDIEKQIRGNPKLAEFQRFLLRTPAIDGQPFSSTTRKYLQDHFAQGAYARPRNYFYPDQEKWTGPVPIHALYYMVEGIIEVADGLIHALEDLSAE